MSVSNIGSNYGYYQSSGGHQQRKSEIDALSQALQSGDISSAQQAFSALFTANASQSSASSNSGTDSNSNSGGDVVADISALGKALSSGDLSSAQDAFSALQDDIKNSPPPPPPPPRNQSSDDSTSTSSSDTIQSLFEQLAEALQSGDLTSAQSAFASLQTATSATQTDAADSANPLSTDIESLSSALSSGDLSSAQTAFAQLQEDLQNAPPPPPPGGPNGGRGPGGENGDQVQQAFSDLASALESGDIDAAKTAFATLQSLAPSNQDDSSSSTSTDTTASTNSTTATDTIGTDLSSLSDALESGDLTSAQSLFQTLLEDLQAGAQRHPGMHHYSQNSGSDSSSSNSVSVSA